MPALVAGIHVFRMSRHSIDVDGRNKSGHDEGEAGVMKKSFVRGTWQAKRAYSPAVITEGAGKTIWVAGHTGTVDEAGKSLAGDFDAQCRQTFRNIEKTLDAAGATFADLVTMTVFLIAARSTTPAAG